MWFIVARRAFPDLESSLIAVLNKGTLKQLKQLREFGEKRSRLLIEHRVVCGPIATVHLLLRREVCCCS